MKRLLLIGLFSLLVRNAQAVDQWPGTIPPFADDQHRWEQLIKKMMANQMYYGTLAASERMLTFFSDLPTKELAYRTMIELIDLGYPFPTKNLFVAGDIEPSDSNEFTNSYFFYKGLIAQERGMHQWAEHYFSNIDKDKFPKYLFFVAINAYSKKDYHTAEEALKKILAMDLPIDQSAFIKKVARTLARLYFEQENYAKSQDIYESFLLKVNPINVSDWLEAGWNLYYLKKYDQALGYLYNLEAKSAGESINLEKYLLRGLIYQRACDVKRMDTLQQTFERDFGQAVYGIKSGENLGKLSQLKTIYYPDNTDYNQALTTLRELKREQSNLRVMPYRLMELAKYLYSSEINNLSTRIKAYSEQALFKTAAQLITMAESLRFLKFDVSRERLDPDAVFQVAEPTKTTKTDKVQEAGFEIRWMQLGDFWRDERIDYRGMLRNRCQ